jgi:glucose/arabinose dehydrogenase
VQTEVSRPDGNQWDEAVALTFDEIGRLWVVERGGRIWIVDPDDPHGAAPEPFIDISDEVGSWQDHGMLSAALDPNFTQNGYVYLFYIVDRHHLLHCNEAPGGIGEPVCDAGYDPTADEYLDATIGRITRYQAVKPDGEDDYHHAVAADYATRKVLVGESIDAGFPVVFLTHAVGTVLFGQDGTLLASFGDSASHRTVDRGGLSTTYQDQAIADNIMRPEDDVGALRAQNINSLNGKVIRIDPATGDGLASNPFFEPADPRSARSRVWALGLRNPFRVSLRPGSGSHFPSEANPGALYIGDVGWQNFEELNVADRPGMNFGWPLFEGMEPQFQQNGSFSYSDTRIENTDAPNPLYGQSGCSREYFRYNELIRQDTLSLSPLPNPCDGSQGIAASTPAFTHRRPVISWFQDGNDARWSTYDGTDAEHPRIGESNSAGTKTVTGEQFIGNSSSGGVWYTGTQFPEEYRDTFFLGDFGGQWIRNVEVDVAHEAEAVHEFDSEAGGVVALAAHPLDGSLYYISWATFVNRVEYAPTANQAPEAIVTSDTNYGPSPLTIQFSADASTDPEDDPLTYEWDFGDGSPVSTGVNPQHEFVSADGSIRNFDVTLTVSDDSGNSDQALLRVSVNNSPPVISRVVPKDGTLYSLDTNTTYELFAEYDDAESSINQLSCEWQTVLHHDNHSHDDPPDARCTTSALIQPLGCGVEAFFYRVHLTITDPHGLSVTHTSQLNPNCQAESLLPVISVQGDDPYFIIEGGAYIEFGATAEDHAGADLSLAIQIDAGSVDTSTPGSYDVNYDVTDGWGNSAQTVTRVVIVEAVDVTPPVITLIGANPQAIAQGDPYSELGASASDDTDGDLTDQVIIDASAVNTNVVGSYTVTYNVSDSSGNAAVTATRTISITAPSPPPDRKQSGGGAISWPGVLLLLITACSLHRRRIRCQRRESGYLADCT